MTESAPLVLVKFHRKTFPHTLVKSYTDLGILVVNNPKAPEFPVATGQQHCTRWTLPHLRQWFVNHLTQEWMLLRHCVVASVVTDTPLVLRQRWHLTDVLKTIVNCSPSLDLVLAQANQIMVEPHACQTTKPSVDNSNFFARYYCVFEVRHKFVVDPSSVVTVRPRSGVVVGTIDSDMIVASCIMCRHDLWIGQVASMIDDTAKELILHDTFQVSSPAPLPSSAIRKAVMEPFFRVPLVFDPKDRDPSLCPDRVTDLYVLLRPQDFVDPAMARLPLQSMAVFLYMTHRLDYWAWHFVNQGRADAVKLARCHTRPQPDVPFGVTVLGTVAKHPRFAMVRQVYHATKTFQQIRDFRPEQQLRKIKSKGKNKNNSGNYYVVLHRDRRPPFQGTLRAGKFNSGWLKHEALRHMIDFPLQYWLYRVHERHVASLKDEQGTVQLTDLPEVEEGEPLERAFKYWADLLAEVPHDWGKNLPISACFEATLATDDMINRDELKYIGGVELIELKFRDDQYSQVVDTKGHEFFVMVFEALCTKRDWKVVYPWSFRNNKNIMALSQLGSIWLHRYFEPVRSLYWRRLLRPLCRQLEQQKHALKSVPFPVQLYAIFWKELKSELLNHCAATIDSNYLLQVMLMALFRHTCWENRKVMVCEVPNEWLVGRTKGELQPHRCLMLEDDFTFRTFANTETNNPLIKQLKQDHARLKQISELSWDSRNFFKVLLTPHNFPSRQHFEAFVPGVQASVSFNLSTMTTACFRDCNKLRLLALQYMRRGIAFKPAKLVISRPEPEYVVLSSGTYTVEGIDFIDSTLVTSVQQLYWQERLRPLCLEVSSFDRATLKPVAPAPAKAPEKLYAVCKLFTGRSPAGLESVNITISSSLMFLWESPLLRVMVELALLSPDHGLFYFGQVVAEGRPDPKTKLTKCRLLNAERVDDKFSDMNEQLKQLPLLEVHKEAAENVAIVPSSLCNTPQQFRQSRIDTPCVLDKNVFVVRSRSRQLAYAALFWMRQLQDAKAMYLETWGIYAPQPQLVLDYDGDVDFRDSLIGNIWTSATFDPVLQLFRQEQAKRVVSMVMSGRRPLRPTPAAICQNALLKQQQSASVSSFMMVSLKDCQIQSVSPNKTFALKMNRAMQHRPLLAASLSVLIHQGKELAPWIAGRLDQHEQDMDDVCLLERAFMSWDAGAFMSWD